MGNYKNKKQKLQMRFFAIVALLGTAAALRLGHVHKAELAKVAKTSQLNHMFSKKRAQRLIKAQWDELTDEQIAEVEAWVEEQLSEENGTITKKEAHDALLLSERNTISQKSPQKHGQSSKLCSTKLTPTMMVRSTSKSSLPPASDHQIIEQ